MGRPPIPQSSRLPRRYKKNGKPVGNFFQRINGKEVNLFTQNANLALLRRDEAIAGKRRWIQNDDDAEAAPAAPVVVGTGPAKTGLVVEPAAPPAAGLQSGGPSLSPPATSPPHTAPPALPPIGAPPAAETPPQRESVQPDGYMPPQQGWAAAASAAAAGAPGGAAGGEDDGEAMDPEFLEQLIDGAAALAVNLQLMLQAWVMRSQAGWQAGDVPEDGAQAKGRVIGKRLWAKEIKKLMPDDLPLLPGWVVAPLMVAAYTLPVQATNGSPIKPEDAAGEGAPAPDASSSPDTPPPIA